MVLILLMIQYCPISMYTSIYIDIHRYTSTYDVGYNFERHCNMQYTAGGLEHLLFFHVLWIIFCSKGLKPTSKIQHTIYQCIHDVTNICYTRWTPITTNISICLFSDGHRWDGGQSKLRVHLGWIHYHALFGSGLFRWPTLSLNEGLAITMVPIPTSMQNGNLSCVYD